MADVQATFFATLIDEWARAGVTDAVVCPGNRSSLLSILLEQDDRFRVHVFADERSGSYFALGLAKATGRPAIFWCTSGTATAQVHSAVIEANYAQVPFLVVTANRPPEAQHVRDWQSIDQTQLFAGMTRWQFAPGVADDAMESEWRSIASRSVLETMHAAGGPGPVHLDLAIREPWSLDADELPVGRSNEQPWHQHVNPSTQIDIIELGARRGVFVVGESDIDADALYDAADRLGWPVLAEARSGLRSEHANCVSSYDSLLRSADFVAAHKPDLVISIGTPPISKFVPLLTNDAEQWVIDPNDVWAGAKNGATLTTPVDPTAFCEALMGEPAEGWLTAWQHAEEEAQESFDTEISLTGAPTEPAVARLLSTELSGEVNLFAATSMPVRDVEAFSGPALAPAVYANRGASGMEGLTSTAAGVAVATEAPTVLLIGDLSFLYDLNALWALNGVETSFSLTVVVLDNNGGGIFSTLPQLKDIDKQTFERVIATPQNVNIPNVVESFGIKAARVGALEELIPTVDAALETGGLNVVYVKTDRTENAELRQQINAAVASVIS